MEEVVVGVAAAGGLADLGVPGELGVEAVESPEAVGAQRESPRRLGALAPLLHPVHVLPLRLVPLVRVLHEAQDQVLRELHDETHGDLSSPLSLSPRNPHQPSRLETHHHGPGGSRRRAAA